MVSSSAEEGFFAQPVIEIDPCLPGFISQPIDLLFIGCDNPFTAEKVERFKTSQLHERSNFSRMSKIGISEANALTNMIDPCAQDFFPLGSSLKQRSGRMLRMVAKCSVAGDEGSEEKSAGIEDTSGFTNGLQSLRLRQQMVQRTQQKDRIKVLRQERREIERVPMNVLVNGGVPLLRFLSCRGKVALGEIKECNLISERGESQRISAWSATIVEDRLWRWREIVHQCARSQRVCYKNNVFFNGKDA